MKQLALILASMLLYAVLVHKACANETVIEEVTFQSLNVLDMSQTLYISKHPEAWYEKESAWIVGEHPSQRSVMEYMAAEAIIHATVTVALADANAPKWLQRTWQFVTIADKAHCVGHNFSIGIRLAL